MDSSAFYTLSVPIRGSSRADFDLEGAGWVTLALHGVGGKEQYQVSKWLNRARNGQPGEIEGWRSGLGSNLIAVMKARTSSGKVAVLFSVNMNKERGVQDHLDR